jgi:branched-chain amino acid transport system ATP-binding protein
MSDTRSAGEQPILSVSGLTAGYHGGSVLKGVDLEVSAGEVLALLGRNGVGKSTLAYTVSGLIRPTSGSILVGGWEARGQVPHLVARRGVGLVPQGRRVWPGLTVDEHLRISAGGRGRWNTASLFEMFPRLEERRKSRADTLSGGEQQMLAIARALIGNPRILLLDEPSEGLAPMIVSTIGGIIRELADEGMAVLLIEQNLGMVQDAADRVAIVDRGVIAFSDSLENFRHRPDVAAQLLGVAAEEVA